MIKNFDLDAGIDYHNEHVRRPNEAKMSRKKVGRHLWGQDSNIRNNAVTMSKWQKGKVIPDLDTYFRIIEYLGCPPSVVIIPFDYELPKQTL
jgi:transcriptional regulator with XRE-family HTH domain